MCQSDTISLKNHCFVKEKLSITLYEKPGVVPETHNNDY